jgi:DNA topoisomerase-1
MAVAQRLYEGIEIGGHTEGLITYMRTDSLSVAPAAQAAARAYILARWGERAAPAKPNVYKARTKGAQEAHEAIRPTDPDRDPDSLKGRVTPQDLKLYRLIWQRFIASQMSPALLDVTTVDIAANLPDSPAAAQPAAIFRATGSVIRYPGFLQVYRESVDDGDDGFDETTLPALAAADALRLLDLTPEQHFTQPPPRFTEASLVKQLEESGIGRPSTYASIIATILDREYVEKVEKQLRPTALGAAVTDLLVAHFADVLDPGFTAAMEQHLDDVAAGERAWTPVIDEFYRPFAGRLELARTEMKRVRLPATEIGEACPACGQPLVQRGGRFGQFIACSGYPTCTYSRPRVTGTGVACPACREGELVERRGKQSGKAFWSCSRYPACAHVEWYLPLPTTCARCGGHLSQVARGQTRCVACDGQPPRRVSKTPPKAGPAANASKRRASTTPSGSSGSTGARRGGVSARPPAKRMPRTRARG